ncbi:hypothetical protein FOL47_003775 [Perkinsus chesapeaki]|uniref:Uncharacterized protein n=1 Tax=Perkinsus chesapeaki TaxID=330153 RepID=A0A7J6MZI9_PERCH|nr:hypothetical protein FOL47_003775 [Perkinsus chesapeaki]
MSLVDDSTFLLRVTTMGHMTGLTVIMLLLPLKAVPLLDCTGQEGWATFREVLTRDLSEGTISSEALGLASDLVQHHEADILPDDTLPFRASGMMIDFWLQANGHGHRPQCLYGAASALWLLGDVGGDQRMLELADHLLGASGTKRNLAFLEDSQWPLSVSALIGDGRPLHNGPLFPFGETSLRQPRVSPPIAPIRLVELGPMVVWEAGVHASLSAEVLNMLKLVGGTRLQGRRRLIQRQYPRWLPDICGQLYSGPIGCDTHRDSLTEVFERYLPDSDTTNKELNWETIEAMKADTVAAALRASAPKPDMIVCTVPVLCVVLSDLAVTMDVLLVGYFGHPALFMVNREDTSTKEKVWSALVDLSKRGILITSDPFLSMQYEYQLGVSLPFIRTHGLYTHATYRPLYRHHILVWDRPHDTALTGTIQHIMEQLFDASEEQEQRGPQPAIRGGGYDPDGQGFRTMAGHVNFPYTLVTRKALEDTSYRAMSQFQAVVLFPYDMDLVTFYEFYSMFTPLFMPSSLDKYLFFQNHKSYDGRFTKEAPVQWRGNSTSPFDEGNPSAVREILGFVDYFSLPGIRYFSSIADLLRQLDHFNDSDAQSTSAKMRDFFHEELGRSLEAWRRVWLRAQ